MILVTGAAGKTGQAITKELVNQSLPVRAWVHRPEQVDDLMATGATEAIAGDAGDWNLVCRAIEGVQSLYFISPNVTPQELTFARLAMKAAIEQQPDIHFVYHSVLHPQTKRMPHHWLKLRVEELLFESGLSFTILQPAAYMQNILVHWLSITQAGIYPVPYGPKTRLGMVDLEDVAQAAAAVLSQAGHRGAIYELAGPEALSQTEVGEILSRELGRNVRVQQIALADWEREARDRGLGQYQIRILSRMFNYYDQFGFWGNSNILRGLLGRRPVDFAQFVARSIVQLGQ
jgi:uncharacterized protein YbjT (DUF2867 family)